MNNSKRVKLSYILHGLTPRQWEELIIKPYLTYSVEPLLMLKQSCKFFARGVHLDPILYHASRMDTFRRLRMLRDILRVPGTRFRIHAIKHDKFDACYYSSDGREVSYGSVPYSGHMFFMGDTYNIYDAAKSILREIRNNHLVKIEEISERATECDCRFNIVWDKQVIPEALSLKSTSLVWNVPFITCENSLTFPTGMDSLSLVKCYSNYRKERGYWDMDSAIDMEPDLSLSINDDLLL